MASGKTGIFLALIGKAIKQIPVSKIVVMVMTENECWSNSRGCIRFELGRHIGLESDNTCFKTYSKMHKNCELNSLISILLCLNDINTVENTSNYDS